jgi:microcystin-dependent protein
MEVYLGTILPFAFPYAPQGWIACGGGVLPISQNSALYALLGVTYGGDGSSTFGIPNLSGRTPVSQGAGYAMGQAAGSESVTLLTSNLPSHTHTLAGTTAAAGASVPDATNNVLAAASGEDVNLGSVAVKIYGPAGTVAALGPQSIGMTGSNMPVSVMQPYLTVNYCMAVQGIYPSRP